jgi:beta-glucosidase
MDFVGINYYFRAMVGSDGGNGYTVHQQPGVERTQMGWEVHPDSLRDLLVEFHQRYPDMPPVYITENGMASDDHVQQGRVHDEQRMRYLGRHFAAIQQAMDQGVDVRGYFVWSLLDNFEWAQGYSRRFGLVYVDLETQVRIPKLSAQWYQQVARRGEPNGMPPERVPGAGDGERG